MVSRKRVAPVVLPLPGPARMLRGPSLAWTISRWLGEKWSRSTPAQGRQLLWTAVAGELQPAEQKRAVQQVVQIVARALRRHDGRHKSKLLSTCIVAGEEGQRIASVAQDGEGGADGGLGQHVIRLDLTQDFGMREAPGVERELLKPGEPLGRLVAPAGEAKLVGFGHGGHGER